MDKRAAPSLTRRVGARYDAGVSRPLLQNDRVLRALRRKPVDVTPIWIMRQAGRYMPEYRALRAEADFLSLCQTPELAARATLLPIELLGVDAAIIFSDILIPVQAMGMQLVFSESKGPQLPVPIRDRADIDALKDFDPWTDTAFLPVSIQQTVKALDGRVPLLGFAGAPYTLATYMIEGETSKNFHGIKRLAYQAPDLLHRLLERLTRMVGEYLVAQVEAGADAVQIFDTWAGALSPLDYAAFCAPYTARIVETVKKTGAPVILYVNGCAALLEAMAGTGVDAISVDWRVDLAEAKQRVGGRVALQGNLDPCVLYAPSEVIRRHAQRILDAYGREPGHVFNLGHGILPDVSVESAKTLVHAVHDASRAIRSS
jgi:uroporphyrinogen decarboxylase